MIQTGSIALLAFIVGDYASKFAPLGAHSSAVYAALIVVLVTAVNVGGRAPGQVTQNVLTSRRAAGPARRRGRGSAARRPAGAAPAAAAAPSTSGSPAFGLVMVFVLLTYGGWNEAAYVSAEVRNPAAEHGAGARVEPAPRHRRLPAGELGVPAGPGPGRHGAVAGGGLRPHAAVDRRGRRRVRQPADHRVGPHLGQRRGLHGRPHGVGARARRQAPAGSRALGPRRRARR